MRTTFARFILVILSIAAFFAASQSHAQFARTEDELMEADITEARRRASDFKNYLELKKKRKIQQEEIGPEEVKQAREAFQKRVEEAREAYIRERNARPVTPEAKIAKLERDFDLKRESDEREMERYRQNYLRKRTRVRAIIEKEGYIDERLEIDN